MNEKKRYGDMLSMEYPFPLIRPRMTMEERAAQFSPFAALNGHDAVLQETGRLTQERVELNEDRIAALNETLRQLDQRIQERPQVAVTYFQPDLRKEGGAYLRAAGRVLRIDKQRRLLWLEEEAVELSQIYSLELL